MAQRLELQRLNELVSGRMASSNLQGQASTWQQKLQRIGQTPTAISAIASVGLHGLLFAVLPFLPDTATRATEPEIRDPVEVVELTPEEQQRLPDFSLVAPIELPPIAEPPQSGSDLFTLPTTPPPSIGNSSLFPSSSADSLLAPPLPVFVPPSAPLVEIPSFTIPIPQSPRLAAPPAAPSVTPPSPANPSPQASPPASPAPESSPSPSVAVEPGPEAPESEPSPQASPSVRSEAQLREDLIAQQQELRALYTYNPAGTRQGEAQTSFAAWFYEELGKTGNDFDRLKKQEITVDYPKIACPLKQSRFAEVGVVVDADNQIVGDPRIIQSSGYPLFNQEALKVVQAQTFENTTDGEQVHLIRVAFEYSEDVCPPGLTPIAPNAPAG